jgi:hypothetical protein
MRFDLLRGFIVMLMLAGSMALVTGHAPVTTDSQQKPGMTPVRPGGSGGVVITYAPAQPQQAPPRATVAPDFVDAVITLPQIPAQTVIRNALDNDEPRLLAWLAGAEQRQRIVIAQQALLDNLTAPPINAVLLSRTTEEANTLTVRVPPGRVSLIQELSGIQSVTSLQPPPGNEIVVTPPTSLTNRPVEQPGYPVITVEAR